MMVQALLLAIAFITQISGVISSIILVKKATEADNGDWVVGAIVVLVASSIISGLFLSIGGSSLE